MTVQEIMDYLQAHGSESIKKILVKHGIKEPFFGVKVEYLKPIQKKIKTDYQLAKDLYATGNADAMYLAGLIADDAKMNETDLQTWAEQAVSQNISEYTLPWVATSSPVGYTKALEWIESPEEHIAAAGWSTLGNWVSLHADSELDVAQLKSLMDRVVQTIQASPSRVRYHMNNFIICLGTYVRPLHQEAIAAAEAMGTVTVIKEGTACKTPDAQEYIAKAVAKGALGKKKKMVKC